jgi:serine/threonine protein kinase
LGNIHRSLAEAELLQSVAHCGRGVGATFYPREVETVMSDQPTLGGETWKAPGSESPGGRIGPFKILQLLGEGGFGSVFEAEQEQPVRRRVALKIIKLGMDTREVIARFEAERQALALMDHPHIARVLDAGATESGRPYFVMELVKGEPISKYCEKHDLSIVQRLELFEQVCVAVQHAHTKGIIHRDLKPSNVMVSTHDDRPFAKVIDFGIAKATSGRLTEKTVFTEANLMMGTPSYMSPEQAEGSADIDTRTDIYSLGVILYELLTDTTPLDSNSLRTAGYAEVQRIIREVEPLRPSVRLARSTVMKVGELGKRYMDPRKMVRMIRGELDWIVMKAIEKDRTRRYETANGLAMDVRRYLAGEAVLAAPPSATYRAGKFIRRNKVVVSAALLIATALLAGIFAFAWQTRIAEQQAHLAQQRATELERVSNFQADMLSSVDLADAGKLLSDDVRDKFKASLARQTMSDTDRLAQAAAFDMQWQHVDATDAARDLLDRTILKPAIVAINAKFKDQPEVDAALRQVLAKRYVDMAMYDAALPLQQSALATRTRVLGADHPDTLASVEGMGDVQYGLGNFADAESSFRRALVARRHILGEDAAETLVSMNSLGLALLGEGKLDDAEPYLSHALEVRHRILGENDRYTFESLSNMGLLLQLQNKLAEAERYDLQALQSGRHVLGEEHTDTLIMINNVGLLFRQEGKFKQAEPYFLEALEKARRVWGDEHENTLILIYNLGRLFMSEHEPDVAAPYAREALEKNRRIYGGSHPSTLMSTDLMGAVDVAQGRYADAVALLAPAEAASRKAFRGDDAPRVALFLMHLGQARTGTGDFAAAERDLIEAQPILVKTTGPAHHSSSECTQSLVDLYTAWSRAQPGKGYEVKAAEWKRKLDELADSPPATTSH